VTLSYLGFVLSPGCRRAVLCIDGVIDCSFTIFVAFFQATREGLLVYGLENSGVDESPSFIRNPESSIGLVDKRENAKHAS
jgi:hypothetical protein